MIKDTNTTLANLARIEGQIKGVTKMVEDGRECEEVIPQLLAISGAINSVAKKVLYAHIKGCVVESILEGDKEHGADELVKLLEQLFKVK